MTRARDLVSRPFTIALAGAALAMGVLAPAAHAQRGSGVEPVTARWMLVDTDEVTARCGDLDRYYAVAKLDAGTMLTVDGESDEWLRVRYPEAVTPMVPVDDARATGDGFIELTRESGLRAPSLMMGLAGSWKSVYDPPLDAGSRLEIVEAITSDAGQTLGWRVVAPEPPVAPSYARAYVRRAGVRNAKAMEVEAHLSTTRGAVVPEDAAAPAADSVAEQTNGVVDDILDAGEDAVDAVADATGIDSDALDDEADTSLLGPMTPEGDLPRAEAARPAAFDIVGEVDQNEVAQGEGDPAAVIDNADPNAAPDDIFAVTLPDSVVDGYPDTPETIAQGAGTGATDPGEVVENDDPDAWLTPAALQDLEATFESTRKLPREELDVALDELLAEYTRAYNAADEPALQRSLDQRIEYINLRIATRDERRRLESVLRDVDQREVQLRQRVQEWRSGRAFTLVGRIARSRVYDGVRLPLMYRVESVEPLSASRTIGYIRPGDADDIASRVGQIVGIRGRSAMDPELRMVIIDPEEVEVLNTP